MSDDDEHGFELEMPFVTVTSQGGPHDDQSYVAGWEMGTLDALLISKPPFYEGPIAAANEPQADRIAMKHGYSAKFEPTAFDEWVRMTLTKSSGGVD